MDVNLSSVLLLMVKSMEGVRVKFSILKIVPLTIVTLLDPKLNNWALEVPKNKMAV